MKSVQKSLSAALLALTVGLFSAVPASAATYFNTGTNNEIFTNSTKYSDAPTDSNIWYSGSNVTPSGTADYNWYSANAGSARFTAGTVGHENDRFYLGYFFNQTDGTSKIAYSRNAIQGTATVTMNHLTVGNTQFGLWGNLGTYTINGAMTINGEALFDFDTQANTVVLNASLSGSGLLGFTRNSAVANGYRTNAGSTITLAGNNSAFAGPIQVNGGKLKQTGTSTFGNGSATNVVTMSSNVQASGTSQGQILFSTNDTVSIASKIAGTGNLTKEGSGSVTLTNLDAALVVPKVSVTGGNLDVAAGQTITMTSEPVVTGGARFNVLGTAKYGSLSGTGIRWYSWNNQEHFVTGTGSGSGSAVIDGNFATASVLNAGFNDSANKGTIEIKSGNTFTNLTNVWSSFTSVNELKLSGGNLYSKALNIGYGRGVSPTITLNGGTISFSEFANLGTHEAIRTLSLTGAKLTVNDWSAFNPTAADPLATLGTYGEMTIYGNLAVGAGSTVELDIKFNDDGSVADQDLLQVFKHTSAEGNSAGKGGILTQGGDLVLNLETPDGLYPDLERVTLMTAESSFAGAFANITINGLAPAYDYTFTNGVLSLSLDRSGVPEPASWLLLLGGAAGLFGFRRFRSRQAG